jgi:hypothetical protein
MFKSLRRVYCTCGKRVRGAHSYRFQLVRMTAERICIRDGQGAGHSILMRGGGGCSSVTVQPGSLQLSCS